MITNLNRAALATEGGYAGHQERLKTSVSPIWQEGLRRREPAASLFGRIRHTPDQPGFVASFCCVSVSRLCAACKSKGSMVTISTEDAGFAYAGISIVVEIRR